MPVRSRRFVSIVLSLASQLLVISAWASKAEGSPVDSRIEYGISLALRGRISEAESAFVAALSISPNDSRALTNLGNLRVLRGEFDVGLSFYRAASASDSLDAGIVLNKAIALHLLGKSEESLEAATSGVILAGGAANAASLFGLPEASPSDSLAKGAQELFLSSDEISELLQSAAAAVPSVVPIDGATPSDVTVDAGNGPGVSSDSSEGTRLDEQLIPRRQLLWRSGGLRGAAARDGARLLYWKERHAQ